MTDARRAGRSRSPTHIDSHVGEKVRRLRQSRKLSLSELAALIGLSHQQLQKYETGVNRISAGMLYDLSRVLHVPMEEFFSGLEAESEPEPVSLARARCMSLISATHCASLLSVMARVLLALLPDEPAPPRTARTSTPA